MDGELRVGVWGRGLTLQHLVTEAILFCFQADIKPVQQTNCWEGFLQYGPQVLS